MEATIGLEIHVHLLTESKLFCRCSTATECKEPNENTCPICMGFPGNKPLVNKRAIEQGLTISEALNCDISPEVVFSRKNYFYPDMPKNFQITQYEIPLGKGGYLVLGEREIGIRRVHLEEDPAKLVHVGGDIISAKHTLIDHNRAGIPLVEIVTEPDIEDTKEAREFLEKLSLILDHLGVYDPSGEGSIRIDANVSLGGGQRVEVKNITGFRNVEKALNYEIVRQRSMARMGLDVGRETRHFESDSETTVSLRKKETEEDYGYIIEPDLVKIRVTSDWLEGLHEKMPELPDQRVQRFMDEYGLSRFQSRVLVHSGLDLSNFYEKVCQVYHDPQTVANWVVTYLLKSLNFEGLSLSESKVRPETFVELLELIDEGTISERLAKELIKEYTVTGESPRNIVKEKRLGIMPADELKDIIDEVIEDHPQAVDDYHGGTEKAVEFLIGQVLRRVRARAKPNIVRKFIMEKLDSREKMPR
jgi:aspartyl-tRNA(Asn)/glutamyl-tRNA(Gln) amidotransferase subunit B